MSKVISADAAAQLLHDGDIVSISSSSGLGCPDKVLAAIGARFEREGRPRGITTLNPIAAGDMYGVKVRFHSRIWPQLTLEASACTHLYRIAQECLQNVVKHANADRARLTFFVSTDTARLEIVDDGVGFDTFEHPLGGDEMGGYGLLSMAERAEIVGGRLNIR